MDLPPPDFRQLRHTSDEYPVEERIAIWRELLSRKLLHVEIEPLTLLPFQVDASLRLLPGIRFGIASFAPSINRRTRAIVEADNDDLFILVNLEGELTVALGDVELALAENDGCLMSCKQEGNFIRATHGRLLFARFDRATLTGLVPDIEDCIGRVIRGDTEALTVMTTFMRYLDHNRPLKTEAVRRTVVNHCYDYAALALNPLSESASIARERGLGAGRLRTIKAHVAKNLRTAGLSLSDIAAACKLSLRQVQRLFETEGTTFSLYLLGKRLALTHAALSDRRQAHRGISEIALDSGFGDVSYFNRAFRRRYGQAPSEVRNAGIAPSVGPVVV